jgi:hypothetical protein
LEGKLLTKATVTLPSGTKVVIEGTVDEVEAVLKRYERPSKKLSGRLHSKGATTDRKLGDYVIELREAGLFKKPQGLADIRNALQAEGHIVPVTTLSGVMLGLVKARQLRRFREDKTWKYVNR